MTKKVSIAIDAMGGDNSPDKTIEGIKIFIDKNKLNNDFKNIFTSEAIIIPIKPIIKKDPNLVKSLLVV